MRKIEDTPGKRPANPQAFPTPGVSPIFTPAMVYNLKTKARAIRSRHNNREPFHRLEIAIPAHKRCVDGEGTGSNP